MQDLPYTDEEFSYLETKVKEHQAELERLNAELSEMRRANNNVRNANEREAAQKITPTIAKWLTTLTNEDAFLYDSAWRQGKKVEISVRHDNLRIEREHFLTADQFSRLRTAGYIKREMDAEGNWRKNCYVITDEARTALEAYNAKREAKAAKK